MKCFPSGRNFGPQQPNFLDLSTSRTRTGAPPEVAIWYRPLEKSGTYSRVSSRFQLPPPKSGASATTLAAPPDASRVFSFLSAENQIKSLRLSGDQIGQVPSSVPAKGRAASESKERIQSCVFPFSSLAENATVVPSGESIGPPLSRPKLN